MKKTGKILDLRINIRKISRFLQIDGEYLLIGQFSSKFWDERFFVIQSTQTANLIFGEMKSRQISKNLLYYIQRKLFHNI